MTPDEADYYENFPDHRSGQMTVAHTAGEHDKGGLVAGCPICDDLRGYDEGDDD